MFFVTQSDTRDNKFEIQHNTYYRGNYPKNKSVKDQKNR